MNKFKHIDTWLFDLDNTIYNAEDAIFQRMSPRITSFIEKTLNVSKEEAEVMRKRYWEKYSATLHGLVVEHDINPNEFLEYALDIDISDTPQCAITKEKLSHIKGRKIIFTNSSTHFTNRMLKHLNLDHIFDGIFSIEDGGFIPKPYEETYNIIIDKFKIDPKTSCMFEDTSANLKPAYKLGMTTVWLHGKNQDSKKGNEEYISYTHEKLSDWLLETVKKDYNYND